MLKPCYRLDRRDEQGQVLILALAFVAFVAVVAGAVLGYADVTQLQHKETASTASLHSPSEGAGLYALVDSSRPDAPACAPNGGGSLAFTSGETLTYQVGSNGCSFSAGNPGSSGSPCIVCVLGNVPGVTNLLDLNRPETVTGEVDVNGQAQLKNTGSLCVKKSSASVTCDGTVVVHNGTWSGTLVPPTTLKMSTSAMADPFAGIYPAPDVRQAGVKVGGVWQPGVYSTLQGSIAPGTYVVTGELQDVTPVDPNNKGVTVFLACLTSGQPITAWRACSSTGEAGADVRINNTTLTINAPATGVYAHLALFSDPNNTSSVTETGGGQPPLGEAQITGSVDLPRMVWSMRGNGATLSQGRLIVGSVTALVGNNDAALGVGGDIPTAIGCSIFSDTLTESVGGSTTSSKGHVVLQTACNGGNQIVSFDYQP